MRHSSRATAGSCLRRRSPRATRDTWHTVTWSVACWLHVGEPAHAVLRGRAEHHDEEGEPQREAPRDANHRSAIRTARPMLDRLRRVSCEHRALRGQAATGCDMVALWGRTTGKTVVATCTRSRRRRSTARPRCALRGPAQRRLVTIPEGHEGNTVHSDMVISLPAARRCTCARSSSRACRRTVSCVRQATGH